MMKARIQKIFQESIDVKEKTLEANHKELLKAIELISKAIKKNSKILLFGNGGSAADSQHIAAEFVGRFQKERRALPALALTTDTSILTALSNDYSTDIIFARQVEALGKRGDVVIGISTSGNSKNVVAGLRKARSMGLKTIAFLGNGGGKIKSLADCALIVPSKVTARIQESHICMAHAICELVESNIASRKR